MAEGGGDFGYNDPDLDFNIDNDYMYDDDDEQEENTTQPFQPGSASTPYNGGEQYVMQAMQHEQSGLPDTLYEETPLLGPGSITNADIERRLKALKEDTITGIINTTKMMDTSVNPLSEEDRATQIERVKKIVKMRYPNGKVDTLVIRFSQNKANGYCAFGTKGL